MAVDLFQDVDRSKVDRLPFIKGTYPFGYITSNYIERLGIIYEVEEADARKLSKVLKGKDDKIIGKKDRVYVLPGCKVPQFKIKDFCKGIGAVFTGKVEDATVVVGNPKMEGEDWSHNSAYYTNSTSLLFYTLYSRTNGWDDDLEVDDVVKNYYPDSDKIEECRYNMACSYSNNENIRGGVPRLMYAVTPYAMKVIYEILSRKVPIITEDQLLEQMPTVTKLDKVMCEELLTMLNAGESDQKTAHEILANCDHKDSKFYLYRIARAHSSQFSRSRFKNIRLFYNEANIQNLAGTGEETFMEEARADGTLNKEILDALLPIVEKQVAHQLKHARSEIFEVKMTLIPEYSSILGEEHSKIINNVNIDKDDYEEEL